MTTTQPTAPQTAERTAATDSRSSWVTLATGVAAVCLSLIALAEMPGLPTDAAMPMDPMGAIVQTGDAGTTVPSADRLEAVASYEPAAPTF